jgi:hypothetical protein
VAVTAALPASTGRASSDAPGTHGLGAHHRRARVHAAWPCTCTSRRRPAAEAELPRDLLGLGLEAGDGLRRDLGLDLLAPFARQAKADARDGQGLDAAGQLRDGGHVLAVDHQLGAALPAVAAALGCIARVEREVAGLHLQLPRPSRPCALRPARLSSACFSWACTTAASLPSRVVGRRPPSAGPSAPRRWRWRTADHVLRRNGADVTGDWDCAGAGRQPQGREHSEQKV